VDFDLKKYQECCLKTLERFLLRARDAGAKAAFNASDSRPTDKWGRRQEYATIPNWPESEAFPYVCLRVPTGGGKTIIAAHAVGVATKKFLQAERSVVLWLAPSEPIVTQTIKAVRDRHHPYRRALDDAFGGCVTVLDVDEALYVKPGTMDADTTIIVTTIQAFRREKKEGLRVYRGNGELIDHFANLSAKQTALLEQTDDEGQPVASGGVYSKSLANVLRLRMPIVIVDEAHNARSDLSFEMLRRFNPSAIIELTATPAPHTRKNVGSNVLLSVTAADLKAEQMIKLPIRMVARTNPQEAISSAINKREQLERLAAEEESIGGKYIRPIVLFQAQSKQEGEQRITAEVLRELLIKDYDVKETEVAVRISGTNELPDDVMSRDCKLKYVITVSALREGWDCPFAYVLCSVANLSAAGAVEQILGRVLRLPYAKEKRTPQLNQAYAYVTSTAFQEAASSIKDALVESGFERYEADAAVIDDGPGGGLEPDSSPLFGKTVAEVVTTRPAPEAMAALPKPVREGVTFQKRADTGETELIWTGGLLTNQQAEKLSAVFTAAEDQRAVQKIVRRSEGRDDNPAAFGDRLDVPQHAVADPTSPVGWTLFDIGDREIEWSLSDCDAKIGEDALNPAMTTAAGATIDVAAGGKVAVELLTRLQEQMQLRDLRGPKTPERMEEWLDREMDVPEATQRERREYIARVIGHLTVTRGMSFEQLVPLRWRLVNAIEIKIDEHRMKAARRTYQQVLFEDKGPKVEVRPEVVFEFPRQLGVYPVVSNYDGNLVLRKHFYKNIAAMEPEEAACAALIAAHPNVAYWVRNLTRGQFAFRLPLSDRGFYPDFVAMLKDGRIAVIEYKGAVYRTNDDSKEKDLIGKLWAARSGGRCVFELVGLDDMQQRIEQALSVKQVR
jgi:type III restriction enzyme